ncbi:hypothetical protein AVEN_265220-1, partial [Araneus ventricosus]
MGRLNLNRGQIEDDTFSNPALFKLSLHSIEYVK